MPEDKPREDHSHADEISREAERQLRICSACLYCEDICAVFPALAGRHAYPLADIAWLANLCHSCGGCHAACQYAPPHELDIALPAILAQARQRSYADYARPRGLAGAFAPNLRAVALITVFSVLAMVLLARIGGASGASAEAGAFYRVIPMAAMAGAAGLASLWALVALAFGARAFWRDIGPGGGARETLRALPAALRDAITLRNLGGGQIGCGDRIETVSRARRMLHHMMVAGLAICLAATFAAALYEHALGLLPPFAYLSAPVLLGTGGGALALAGVLGLLVLRLRSDPASPTPGARTLDFVLPVLIALTLVSGFALLVFRETAAMPLLLATHLGLVLAFLLSLPASRFVHGIYRALALLRAEIERRRRRAGP